MNGCGCAQAIRTNNHVFMPSLEPDEDGLGTTRPRFKSGQALCSENPGGKTQKEAKKREGQRETAQGAIGDRHLNKRYGRLKKYFFGVGGGVLRCF